MTAANDESPFHAGERALQERLGVRERVERGGRRMIRDVLPDEHRELLEHLPFLVVGSLDAEGRPWASLVQGEPGFIATPTSRTLQVRALPSAGDPLAQNLRVGAPLGALSIELSTRRRNRVNGRVLAVTPSGFELAVEQTFGNCPQYIQARRALEHAPRPPAPALLERGVLSERACAILAAADTAFIASASAEPERGGVEGVDVSHRGGQPGFLQLLRRAEQQLIALPDFRGNFMFNTLGNLEVNPRAGLLVLDFERGDLLSLSGAARTVPRVEGAIAVAGAERWLEFRIDAGLLLPGALLLAWSAPVFSAQTLATGRTSAAGSAR